MAIYKTILYNVEGRKFAQKAITEESGRRNLLYAMYSQGMVEELLDLGKIASLNYNDPVFLAELERKHGHKIKLWN
jgi:hypothetical protein